MPEQKIYEALCNVMTEIEAVTKNKTNPQQNYKYRSIDDVYNMIQPILGKHKIFILPKVLEIQEDEKPSKSGGVLYYITLTMEYSFYTSDGSYLTTQAIGKAMDAGDKALDKAKSSAMKYLLLQMFVIPTEEDKDIEKDNPEPKATKQKQESTPLNYEAFINRMNEIKNKFELENWGKKHKAEIEALPTEQQAELRKLYLARLETLKVQTNNQAEGDLLQ